MQKDELLKFFEGIKTEEDLQRMVNDRVREGLYLEFKQKQDSRNGQLGDRDKFHFSRALSGFANSDGGILIFGVETRRKDESAKKLKLINEVDEFIKSLKKIMINAVQPFVDQVLIEKIEKQQSATRGFVKCLIPASDKTPHRAMLDKREYYKRSIEGFYRLEHFDLEDMFGRRQKPLLKAITEVEPGSEPNADWKLSFIFRNEGRSIAKYYGFLCTFNDNIEFTGFDKIQDVSGLNKKPAISYENNVGVIHPNGVNHILGHLFFKKRRHPGKVIVQINYYCENMMPCILNFDFE